METETETEGNDVCVRHTEGKDFYPRGVSVKLWSFSLSLNPAEEKSVGYGIHMNWDRDRLDDETRLDWN